MERKETENDKMRLGHLQMSILNAINTRGSATQMQINRLYGGNAKKAKQNILSLKVQEFIRYDESKRGYVQ